MKAITKRQILDNRFAFANDEIVEVNGLELCSLIIEHERMQRQIVKLSNDNDILRALLVLKDCETTQHRYVDLRA